MQKNAEDVFVADNPEKLLSALEKKESYILIPKDFKKEFLNETQLPLSETERMGFELGFRGWATLVSSPIFHLKNALSNESKQQKKIDSKIRKYAIKKQDEEFLLYLRQLDY